MAGKTWSSRHTASVLRASTHTVQLEAWIGEMDLFRGFRPKLIKAPLSWCTMFETLRVAAAFMVGISTYVPPIAARADVLKLDARNAISKLIAYVAQDAGFEGTRLHALHRFEQLVEMCKSC